MAIEGQGDVTQLLAQWGQGDRAALDAATRLVYAELRKIAASYLQRESTGHTLQPTALINEAYLRLVKDESPGSFENRRKFFAFAARLMRQVLVDHARSAGAEKRGGGVATVSLTDAGHTPADGHEFLALNDALDALARLSPRKAQVIELRYFSGLNVEETAEMLDVSIATISREQRMAEAWLSKAMAESP